MRSELELLRAEPRSAIARARGKRAPQNSVMSSLREWERVLIYNLVPCKVNYFRVAAKLSAGNKLVGPPPYLPPCTYALLALRLNANFSLQNVPKIPLDSCLLTAFSSGDSCCSRPARCFGLSHIRYILNARTPSRSEGHFARSFLAFSFNLIPYFLTYLLTIGVMPSLF